MSEGNEDSVKPAKYPKSDTEEHDAIDVLNFLFDSSSVKSYVDSRDKAPNHDGWVELVDDDRSPIGRIVVQVKKLPDDHTEDPKIQMETKHLSYCQVPIEPFILIVVDIENEVAYWKHLTWDWFEEEGLQNQDYKTVNLERDNIISITDNSYIAEWEAIIEATREQIDNYDEYQKLKKHANPAIGQHRPEFHKIHQFLDNYNQLLKNQFNAVREGLFPNVWKFGFGNINYEEDNLQYTLYPIEDTENDAQIRDIEPTWEAVHNLGSNRRSGTPHDNPIDRAPERYAFNELENQVKSVIEDRKLDYETCPFMATEYVYPFVEKYSHLLGLDKKQAYDIDEIRTGYYGYLQFWLSEMIRDILRDHEVGEVQIHIEGYLEREPTEFDERAHQMAREKIEDIESYPPRHRIYGDDFDQIILERMLDSLIESPIESIENPYTTRDEVDIDTSGVTHVLDFYSDEALIENARNYYTNYPVEYLNLIERNFPALIDELDPFPTNFLVVSVDIENIRREFGDKEGWSIQRFWLDGGDEQMRVEVHKAEDEEMSDNQNPWDEDSFRYSEKEYDIIAGGSGGERVLTEIDHSPRPVLDKVHDELRSQVRNYLNTQGVPIKHPEKET